VSNRGLVVLADGRRMISTGVGIALVVAGAILRFAVPATFTYGLNAHVVSVIVMLAGVFGLLLSLLVWGPLGRRRNQYAGFGRRAPPGNGMPARTSRQREVSTSGMLNPSGEGRLRLPGPRVISRRIRLAPRLRR
jgi:hypothetical protein